MIVLSYLWILFIIPLITEKNDPEVQWHAKHGLVLFIAEMIAQAAIWVVSMILGQVWSGFGCGVSLLGPLVWVAFIVIRIIAIMKGVNGQRLIIPGLTDFVSRF